MVFVRVILRDRISFFSLSFAVIMLYIFSSSFFSFSSFFFFFFVSFMFVYFCLFFFFCFWSVVISVCYFGLFFLYYRYLLYLFFLLYVYKPPLAPSTRNTHGMKKKKYRSSWNSLLNGIVQLIHDPVVS